MSYSLLRAASKLLKQPLTLISSKYYSATSANIKYTSIDPLLDRLDNDVKRFGRVNRKDLDEVLEEFRQRQSVSSSQSLLIIRCCGSLVQDELPANRTKLVRQVWKILADRRVPLDISHYNALLRVYVENEYDFSPSEFLSELEQKGIQPNRVTYQRLMWRHCQKGDVEGASKILELMKEQQIPLNNVVLDALVLGHVKQGDVEGAKSVLSAMSTAGLSPTSRTYTLLIGGMVAKSDLKEIQMVIDECQTKEINLTDKDLLDITEECIIAKDEEKTKFFLGKTERGSGYNQEAINLMLRLITKNYDHAAIEVFRTLGEVNSSSDEEGLISYAGSFFVKQLVKARIADERTLAICQQLEKEKLCPNAIYIATELALQSKKPILSLLLLKHMKEQGKDVRQHYFWPILVNYKNQTNKIANVITEMYKEYEVGVNSETIRDYVIPNIGITNNDKIMETLRTVGVPIALASRCIITNLLTEKKLQESAKFSKKFNTSLNMKMHGKQLANAFIANPDVDSFITMVHLSSNTDNYRTPNVDLENKNQEEIESGMLDDQKQGLGQVLCLLASNSTVAQTYLKDILIGLHEKGLGIQSDSADKIQEILGANMTPELTELLNKLTSSDLEVEALELQAYPSIRPSVEQLENRIKGLEEKGENVNGLYKSLLTSYLTMNNYENVKELLVKMERNEFVFTPLNLSQLTGFFLKHDDLENAFKYVNELQSKHPDVKINPLKQVRFCYLLVKENRHDEALKFISTKFEKQLAEDSSFVYKSVCWQILNALAEQGSVEKLKEFFTTLKDQEYIEVTNQMLGPLVKVHLIGNDLKSALSTFEECCRNYKCTPWKNELTKHLITIEDATGLQQLTDLSTLVHGEINSLYDLVFGFVECGRLKQARRILETPGMRIRNQRFSSACERYGNEGKVDYLEGLLEATKDLSHIDRSEVYQQLLVNYTKNEETDKALGLWMLLQEESITPTDQFLQTLAKYLKSKQLDVPFVVPVVAKEEKFISKFDKSLSTNKNDAIESLSESTLSNQDEVDVLKKIQTLIDSNDVETATKLVITLLGKNTSVNMRLLKNLLQKVSQDGNIKLMDIFKEKLTEEQKFAVHFQSKYYSAQLSVGNVDKILEDAIEDLNNGEDIKEVNGKFPKGVFLAVIESNPKLIPKIEEIADKYYARNSSLVGNLLWMNAILTGNKKDAEKYLDKYLKSCDLILYKKILNFCSNENVIEPLDNLLVSLQQANNISSRSFLPIYNTKLKIQLAKNDLNGIENTINDALNRGLTLSDFYRPTLESIQFAFKQNNKECRFSIPSA